MTDQKIDIAKDIIVKHTEREIIEYLYAGMSKVCKTLNGAITKQNLMEVGSVAPALGVYKDVLKEMKNANDLRALQKQL